MNVSAAKVQTINEPCKRFPFARAIEVHTAQQIIVDR